MEQTVEMLVIWDAIMLLWHFEHFIPIKHIFNTLSVKNVFINVEMFKMLPKKCLMYSFDTTFRLGVLLIKKCCRNWVEL